MSDTSQLKHPPIPDGWRMLLPTETILDGDKCASRLSPEWYYVVASIGHCRLDYSAAVGVENFMVIREVER